MKRQNWNEHPKKPDQSAIDNLKIPFHIQAKETKEMLKASQVLPGGKPDFKGNAKSHQAFFSDREYFKTVFISGDDMVQEMLE